jgi:hypothetical protein
MEGESIFIKVSSMSPERQAASVFQGRRMKGNGQEFLPAAFIPVLEQGGQTYWAGREVS